MKGAGIRSVLNSNAYPVSNNSSEESSSKDLLYADSKTRVAFDRLAEKINQDIDYPTLLIENGVQGISTLDLYFDSMGNVDESKSSFTGANRSVRGLLVKAARSGILKWYEMDAFRLEKQAFRNQHFRADFSISYTQTDLSELKRVAVSSYSITRRHYMHECASPIGVDLSCVALKTYGALDNLLSREARVKFEALKDRLEYFDDLELKGLNKLIQK